MNTLEKMLLGGDRAIEFLGLRQDLNCNRDIRLDFAAGLLSRYDALQMLGYDDAEELALRADYAQNALFDSSLPDFEEWRLDREYVRDAQGRFAKTSGSGGSSPSKTKPIKIESALAKKRRETKEGREKELAIALKSTDYADHEQVQKLGELFTRQYIKSTAPTPKERDLFKQKNKVGEELRKLYESGDDTLAETKRKQFQKLEEDYLSLIHI
jgi:hypothetical protein